MITNMEIIKQDESNSYLLNRFVITDQDAVEFLDSLNDEDKIKTISKKKWSE